MRSVVDANLGADERLVLWLEPDLDQQLHYAQGLLVLTDRRLLSVEPVISSEKSNLPPEDGLRSWPVTSALTLRAKDYAGTGMLELIDSQSRLYHWRFTAGKVNAAHRLALGFERLQQGDRAEEEDSAEAVAAVCPNCGALLAPDQTLCPECEAAKTKAPMQSLSRLIGFARPRILVISLGLALMFSSTVAGLIPPYLILLLFDNVLTPFGAGKPTNFNLVWWYLSGFAGVAILTWLLSWARTYVLAWASERIASDLRTRTYAHLQSLSMEFFGGKRTGDLISRLSRDTDRICDFLSIHLLDFINDVLMIALTTVWLLILNPFLAIVTLFPLPVIAYLVQKVRTRLRQGYLLSCRIWSEITSVLSDTIPGIRVVKAFAQERREIDRFQAANNRVLQANDRVNTLWAFFGAAVVFLTDIGLLVVWAFGVYQIYQGHLTVGELVAFVYYISRFYSRMDSMSRMVTAVQRQAPARNAYFPSWTGCPAWPNPRIRYISSGCAGKWNSAAWASITGLGPCSKR